ncbi:thioesterase family protein [Alisedimentitalea sp. MJ-SS2]|uniref:thioesterase family protein n=1 Tax=Aliisedimentitalea sp. MJ-SS2 TaxID=3049795 RepID=UPI002908E174|nr:thioesterase family protein [Alisedimentitalea sp. MJ-SS2]MDU8929716.1 thioesterase family protein [Alisedimentitalea sp. MJ-SS2]
MPTPFIFETTVDPEWIDYNGHMRDIYYGMVFSLAAEAVQTEIGLGEAYCNRTGCSVYLLEDHKYFLKEVKAGAPLRVEISVLSCDDKRYHLYMRMVSDGAEAAISELMELHVSQHPKPHATEMPPEVVDKLRSVCLSNEDARALRYRSRSLALR